MMLIIRIVTQYRSSVQEVLKQNLVLQSNIRCYTCRWTWVSWAIQCISFFLSSLNFLVWPCIACRKQWYMQVGVLSLRFVILTLYTLWQRCKHSSNLLNANVWSKNQFKFDYLNLSLHHLSSTFFLKSLLTECSNRKRTLNDLLPNKHLISFWLPFWWYWISWILNAH